MASLIASPNARATAELDHEYSLDTVGFLKAWDNVDGLFVNYVSDAYKDYFAHQSRFVLQDISKSYSVLSDSKLPYQKLIDDPDVLRQVARTFRSETLLRTKIFKEGHQYRVTIDWLHAPKMDVMATDKFVLDEPEGGKAFGIADIESALQAGLDRLIKQVPFVAMVTGRDNSAITINIGANANLKKGDTLFIATLDEVKKHPLLKTIVDWRMTPTGRAEVDSVDEGIAFCHVTEDEPGRQVSRYQKVVQVIPKTVDAPATEVITDEKDRARKYAERPSLGYLDGTAWIGSYSREYSKSASSGHSGSALFLGAKTDGELWFTREIFADAGFGYGVSSLGQTDLSTQQETGTSLDASVYTLYLAGGYSFFTSPDFFGPRAWLRGGFRLTNYDLPVNATLDSGATGFTSFYLSAGGDLPIRDEFGALISLDFGLLNFVSASWTGQKSSGASNFAFFVGGYYRATPRLTGRLGLDVLANSADFSSNAALSNKIITFGPTLLYYF